MSQFILDASSIGLLPTLKHTVDLCDASGKVLGRFVPKLDLSEWEIVGPEPTEEELQMVEQSKGRRYSTSEVVAHLESLQ